MTEILDDDDRAEALADALGDYDRIDRCIQAHTIHGDEWRKLGVELKAAMARIRELGGIVPETISVNPAYKKKRGISAGDLLDTEFKESDAEIPGEFDIPARPKKSRKRARTGDPVSAGDLLDSETEEPAPSPIDDFGVFGTPWPSYDLIESEETAVLIETEAESEPDEQYLSLNTFHDLPVNLIAFSPYQVRSHFDVASLEDLAASIADVGVQQPVVVREKTAGSYELIMGERRLRASIMAGLATIPAIVRQVSDREAMELGLVENLLREDVRAMELARGYCAMLEAGWTQEEIGEKTRQSQPSISNHMRLLGLPEATQELIDQGDLKLTHGLGLLHYAQWPAICDRMAALAVENDAPSRLLQNRQDIPFRSILIKEGLIVMLWANQALFDIQAVCKECPYNARLALDDASRESVGGSFCMNPAHYEELRSAALREEEERVRVQLETCRAAALATGETKLIDKIERLSPVASYDPDVDDDNAPPAVIDAQIPILETETDADGEPAEAPTEETMPVWAHEAKEAQAIVAPDGAKPLPCIWDLKQGSYAKIEENCPPECTDACPCRAMVMDWGRTHAVAICIDPGRHNAFKATHTRSKRKELKAKFVGLTDRLIQEAPVSLNASAGVRRAAVVASNVLLRVPLEDRRDVAAALRRKIDDRRPAIYNHSLDKAAEVLERQSFDRDRETAWRTLAALDAATLINLAAECLVRNELREKLEFAQERAPLTEFVLDLSSNAKAGEGES